MADKTVLVDDLTSLVGQTKHLSGVQNPVYWLIRMIINISEYIMDPT